MKVSILARGYRVARSLWPNFPTVFICFKTQYEIVVAVGDCSEGFIPKSGPGLDQDGVLYVAHTTWALKQPLSRHSQVNALTPMEIRGQSSEAH